MTVSVLQTVFGTDAAGTGLTEAVTLTVTAGSSIHVAATVDDTTTFTSIASVPVMTWTLRDAIDDATNTQRLSHWTADGAAAGSLVITVTNAVTKPFRGCWASEIGDTSGYDAAATAAHAGQFQSRPGTLTNAVGSGATSTLSTQPACVSAFSMNSAGIATPSPGTGATGTGSGIAFGGGTNTVRAEYTRVTSTAAATGSFTTTSNSEHLTVVAVFTEGSAATGISATFGVTESSDTIVSGLTHGANATLTVTESGDTIVAGATQTTTGIGATLTVTEASDTVVAGLTHGANFSLTVTEASDTVVSGLTHGANATFTVTEASDTIAAGATLVSLTNATFNVTEASDAIVSGLMVGENFTLTVTEASDSVVSSLTAGENFTLNVTEASDTIVAGATTVLAGINATFAATEANDTVVAGLSASVTGNVNVTEGSDTAFGFMDTGNPAVVVTTAGAGGGARKKRLYILPDGTRMYATPSEIAQILKLFYQKKPEEKLTKKQKKFADVVFTQDFEPTEKVVPKVYELKPQYKRVQQLDYVAFLETLRKRDEEEFMMMMEVF